MNLGKLQEIIRDREAWCAAPPAAPPPVNGVAKSWTWLGNWTTTTIKEVKNLRLEKYKTLKEKLNKRKADMNKYCVNGLEELMLLK